MHTIEAHGILDTGADTSVMPMWLLRRLGIQLDKKTRREVYSVSGPLWSYGAKVGLEIECGGRWLDIGVAEVNFPDAPWSRNHLYVRPFLLGLDGFFNNIHMCIDHSKKEFWISVPGARRGVGASLCAPPARRA